MYRGADIPTIQSRVQHIISPGINPNCIVIQVGGNDATKQPANSIISRYESLIRNIRHRCPDAKIVLSKVPPRRGNARTLTNISEINVSINKFANTMKNVCSVSVCPTSVLHFKKDCTHLNTSGMDLYARNLSVQLRFFFAAEDNRSDVTQKQSLISYTPSHYVDSQCIEISNELIDGSIWNDYHRKCVILRAMGIAFCIQFYTIWIHILIFLIKFSMLLYLMPWRQK